MKNILFLTVFLFIASFSFVGCSDDPVGDITGPASIYGPQGDTGATGPKGDTGADGADAVGNMFPTGYHIDIDGDGIIRACPDGYHVHPGSPDNECRQDRENLNEDGCWPGVYWNAHPEQLACQTILGY